MKHLEAEHVRIEPHPTARSRAVATSSLVEGSTIAVIPSLANVLLPSEKGHRCDFCFQRSEGGRKLRKCTGCVSYWYCSTHCQSLQWKEHHRKICKGYLSLTGSISFQALATHQQLDVLLLAHLLGTQAASLLDISSLYDDDLSSPISIFLSLLPGPGTLTDEDEFKVPIPDLKPTVSPEIARRLYSRFSNNNFAIHSHLSTVGHGIFPFASRLFNHSCYPNAVSKYLFTSAGVTMEVIALRKIDNGEEICIPYLDPAMLQTRQKIFDYTYGFRCTCPSCVELEYIGPISPPPSDPKELAAVASSLRDFMGLDGPFTILPSKPTGPVPRSIHCAFHETYLSNLSETFSRSSHESQYPLAMEAGVTLLGAYLLIYPPTYPQIGMHLLELAKTGWNMFISTEVTNPSAALMVKQRAQAFLNMGREILMIVGREGDVEGPLSEVVTLQSLLKS